MIACVPFLQSMSLTPSAMAQGPQDKAAPSQESSPLKPIEVQISGDKASNIAEVQLSANAEDSELTDVVSPESFAIGTQELSNFYFYIDAGDNAAGGPPSPAGCNDRGTGPHWGIVEGDITWDVASSLKSLLIIHGVPQSHIFMSRPTATKYVTLENRVDGTDPGGTCTTYGNNRAYIDNGSLADNWRFLSIHFNCCVSIHEDEKVEVFRKRDVTNLLADDFAENVAWQLNRPHDHGAPPLSGDWTNPGDPYVVRKSYPWQNNQLEQSYNILAEGGYISELAFNQWIQSAANKQALAYAYYRGLTDFFVVGKKDTIRERMESCSKTTGRMSCIVGIRACHLITAVVTMSINMEARRR